MRVTFTQPVQYCSISRCFTGDGIPPIPADASIHYVDGFTIYLAPTGEAWQYFNGAGKTVASGLSYWPDLALCGRDWAKKVTSSDC